MERANFATQTVIDQGIILFDRGRRAQAYAYLSSHKVPDHVVVRVLYSPDQRRRYINDFLKRP